MFPNFRKHVLNPECLVVVNKTKYFCYTFINSIKPSFAISAAARLLRGSVSDGSEESLAATSSESDDVIRTGLSAPISPLVGPVRYGCHPSVIPRHFRHRVVAGAAPSLLTQVPSMYEVFEF